MNKTDVFLIWTLCHWNTFFFCKGHLLASTMYSHLSTFVVLQALLHASHIIGWIRVAGFIWKKKKKKVCTKRSHKIYNLSLGLLYLESRFKPKTENVCNKIYKLWAWAAFKNINFAFDVCDENCKEKVCLKFQSKLFRCVSEVFHREAGQKAKTNSVITKNSSANSPLLYGRFAPQRKH